MSQKKKVKVQQYAAKQEKKADLIIKCIFIGLIALAAIFAIASSLAYA